MGSEILKVCPLFRAPIIHLKDEDLCGVEEIICVPVGLWLRVFQNIITAIARLPLIKGPSVLLVCASHGAKFLQAESTF